MVVSKAFGVSIKYIKNALIKKGEFYFPLSVVSKTNFAKKSYPESDSGFDLKVINIISC